jgi:hypothetical protein
MHRTHASGICPRCGALVAPGSAKCEYCGAGVVSVGGAHCVVLHAIGSHPSLVLNELQTFADTLFSQGRGRHAGALVMTINGLTRMLRGEGVVDRPVLLFETDEDGEAERLVKKIEESGGRAVQE